MTNAYCFHRYSTPSQDKGTSIERQVAATSARCLRDGWTIAEVIEDRGRSAWKGDHLKSGNLGKWRARVAAGEIPPGSVLVVENLDRLSRQNFRTARDWIESLTDAGISVAVCNPDLLLDAKAMNGGNIGAIIIHLLESSRANSESNRRSEFRPAVIEAQLEKARRGEAYTKRIPAYLKIVAGKIVPVPERAALITTIYEMAVTQGYDSIAGYLNELITPWNGEIWNIGYIRDLLLSPIVEGEYRPKSGGEPTGEVIHGYYPRIVAPDLVERARAAIFKRDKTGGPKFREAKNMFSGLTRCAECHGKMTRTANRGGSGIEYGYFVCRAARAGACNNKTQYRYDLFEKAALSEILHLALDSSYFVKVDEVAPWVAKVAALKKEVERAEQEQATVLNLLLAMPNSAALQAKLTANEAAFAAAAAALAQAEREMEIARGAVSPEEHLKRVVEVRHAIHSDDEATRLEARRMVRDALVSVVSFADFDRTWSTNIHVNREITLVMKGNHLGFRFDGDGNLMERIDFTGYANDPARADLSKRMMREGSRDVAATERAFADVQRRHRQSAPA